MPRPPFLTGRTHSSAHISPQLSQAQHGQEASLGARSAVAGHVDASARNPSAPRLLVVDDDPDIREMLSDYLDAEGYAVESVRSGEEALDRLARGEYCLIILDIMMPGMSGLDLLRKLRVSSRIPVLMLTARGEPVDRILGLQLGADDYLPKPFVPQELAARVQAVLRRTRFSAHEGSPLIEVGDVDLDPKARLVKRGEEVVDLTSAEFDLLRIFLNHAGQVVSREMLQREVLGRECTPFDRSIDTHVCNLRRKLGSTDQGIERIKSVRGTGYLYSRVPSRKS